MMDLPSEVVAALMHGEFGAQFYCYHEGDCPDPGETYKRCEQTADRILTALTAAGYAVVKVPEETVFGCDVPGHPNNHAHQHYLTVEHGARLVRAGYKRTIAAAEDPHYTYVPAYVIEPAPKEATDGE